MTVHEFIERYSRELPRDLRDGFRVDLHRLLNHERQAERRRLTTDAEAFQLAAEQTAHELRRHAIGAVVR
jgi:hypothetical protein